MGIDEVVVLGHSLGEADMPYFTYQLNLLGPKVT